MSTRCIVLAGGLGTRLRGVIGDVPKCLAPIGSRPFLDHQIDQLFSQGVDEIILSLGHLSQQVIDRIGRHRADEPIRWVVEPQALGTGGAVAYAMDHFGIDETLVANGDTFLSGRLGPMMLPLALQQEECLRMALAQVDDRARFGGVELSGDRVSRFLPKGQAGPGLINAGLYRVHRSALRPAPVMPSSLENTILPALVAARRVRGERLNGEFIDIGVPEDYQRFLASHAT